MYNPHVTIMQDQVHDRVRDLMSSRLALPDEPRDTGAPRLAWFSMILLGIYVLAVAGTPI